MSNNRTPTICQMFPLNMRQEFFRRITRSRQSRKKPWTLFLHSRMGQAEIDNSLARFYDYTKKPAGKVDVAL